MQIIDKQGRLFRKFHLLDLGVMGVIVAMGYGCFVGYWVLSGHAHRTPIEGRMPASLIVELMVQNLDASTVPLIQAGDVQRNRQGAEVLTILAVDAPVPDTMQISFGRQVVDLHRPGRQKLPVLVKIKGEVQGNVCFFENKMIGVGENIILAMPRYSAMGVILRSFSAEKIEQAPEPWHWRRVVVKLKASNITPEVMNTITIGDMMVDEQGIIAAKFMGIKSAFAGMVQLLVEVRCLQAGAVCDSLQLGPIDLGRTLQLNFPGYRLDGEIIDVR